MIELNRAHPFQIKVAHDARGYFKKFITQNDDVLPNVTSLWSECFFTASERGVIRGMHYQRPPFDHDKIVCCISGRILDVALDLRAGTSFGEIVEAELSSENNLAMFIPKGYAHGFQSLENRSVVLYLTTSSHNPSADTGVNATSFDYVWPIKESILSARDAALQDFKKMETPF